MKKELSRVYAWYLSGGSQSVCSTSDIQLMYDYTQEIEADLESIYQPLCDIHFIVKNELGNGIITSTGAEMLQEAVEQIDTHAKSSKWFIQKKGEE